ncbi:hypothetical protein ACTVZO_41475 [Streptomyces sp. IBSNAI002]|uniref:hypothetical protein n=1 Tax=Streptomyces sp. IBSNAI002 TaxID=3457500 RepID=UPI003FD0C175
MSYVDAVAKGAPIAARNYTFGSDGKTYPQIPLGLAVFTGDGEDSRLNRALRHMAMHGVTRAWTGGKVDLPNEEIEKMSAEELRAAPLTPPLLEVYGTTTSDLFGLPGLGGAPARRDTLRYEFVSADPTERHGFIGACRPPTETERRAIDGQVIRDPSSGMNTGVSEREWHKINGKAIARISPAASDGKPRLQVDIGADLFAWSGLGWLGAWGRADSARVVGNATLHKQDEHGQYLKASNFVERQVENTTAGGFYYATLTFKLPLNYGQTYELRWSCSRPSDDGTRDRQDGVTASGMIVFTA